MKLPLLAGANASGISSNISSQECINFYYEEVPNRENGEGTLLPVHGSSTLFTLPNAGGIRGLLPNPIDGNLYVVADNDFYEVDASLTITDRGDLGSTGAYPVSMAFNANTQEIVIADGTEGRHFNCTTNAWSTISDADYPDTASLVVEFDGRFLVNVPGTPGRVQYSAINDGTSWDAGDFFTAESLGSNILTMFRDRGVLWIMGATGTELWYNSGDADDPFQRFERLPVGIIGDTLCKFDNSVVWLARTEQGAYHIVRAGAGFQPEVISTPQISQQLQAMVDAGTSLDTAKGESYIWAGHEFYVLSFLNVTVRSFCYDARTKEWHTRGGITSETNWGYQCVTAWNTVFNSYMLAGDAHPTANGRVYEFAQNVYTNKTGVNIERRVTGPMIAPENEARLRFSEVQVDIEEGVATGAETGNDGQLTLSYSKDGGHTYSTGTQLNLGVGASTGYRTRLIKRKLGYGRLWNFRVYTDTPRRIVIKGAYGRVYNEPFGGFSTSRRR